MTIPGAVIFDLDGVLVDSEGLWNEARRDLVERSGGSWRADAQQAMMGMSSVEWSHYLRDKLGVPMDVEAISAAIVERLARLYRERLPLIPGAREAVISLASRWPLAVASSADRSTIALVLELAGLTDRFQGVVSSEDVSRGKPAPDVYLAAARRVACEPGRCAAVEDSTNGIRAAAAAGMAVIAIPNHAFPPPEEVLASAAVVLASIKALDPGVVAALVLEGPADAGRGSSR